MLLVFLDNAIKFSPEGTQIQVRLQERILTIRDHGAGISKEDLTHVFDRFYKTRGEQNKSGSGLGLAIAKEIAERHGILTELHSEAGKGTTVTLTLPAPEALTEEEKNSV